MDLDKAFEMILHAGNSESASLLGMEAARQYDFEEAEKNCRTAKEELLAAHQIQTELIQAEAGGEKCEMGILMVHAQDHLMTAITTKELGMELIKEIKERRNREASQHKGLSA